MFFTRCKFPLCMWFLLCRCCKWFCCFCSHVYTHKYNSIVITIPIVDGFFSYLITSKFPSYFSQIIVDFNIQSINSIVLVTRLSSTLYHYLFSISFLSLLSSLSAYIFLHPDLMFLNSTDSHMANTKQSVTKFGRPNAMMPVPIVFMLIRSYLVNWPFYLSDFCVNE